MVFTEIFSGIPGVGHGLAAYNKYIKRDPWKAQAAWDAANRSTAVMAGGAVGLLGGPAGVIAGATAAGAVYDTCDSLSTGKPQGVISGVSDIATSIGKGSLKDGAIAVIKTGIYVGADALSGVGGGAIASNIPKEMGKSLVKDAVTTIAKTSVKHTVLAPVTAHVLHNGADRIDSPEQRKWSSGGGHSSSSGGGQSSSSGGKQSSSSNNRSSSGGTQQSGQPTSQAQAPNDASQSNEAPQPPNQNEKPNNGHQEQQNKEREILDDFLDIFQESSLKDICINGVYLFRPIMEAGNKTRRDYLKRLVKQLKLNNVLEEVIRIVKEIMDLMEPSDVSFINFVNLCEFVAQYVKERGARLNEISRDQVEVSEPLEPYSERQQSSTEMVEQEIEDSGMRDLNTEEVVQPGGYYSAITIMEHLKTEMQQFQDMNPHFINEIAAWSHYFKHRIVPGSGLVLSVVEYMGLINSALDNIRSLPEYTQLTAKPPTRSGLVYDIVIGQFGMRRFRLILKYQNGKLVISSGHILDDPIPGDEDGEEYIDADKGDPKQTRVFRNN